MSRNGTMESNVSNHAFQQQQLNLQQLQSLEQNYSNYQQSKSLTSSDGRNMIVDALVNNDVSGNYQNQPSQQQGIPTQQQAQQGQQPQGQPQQQQQSQPQQQQQFAFVQNNSLTSQSQQRQQLQQGRGHQAVASRAISSHEVASHGDPRNPFSISVPINSNPTDILAGRFTAWRSIVTSLIQYLSEIVSIQDEIVRQQIRLSHAVSFPLFIQDNRNSNQSGHKHSSNGPHTGSKDKEVYQQNFFLPQGNGSVQDLPNILINFHASSATLASRTSKEINSSVIPRLEDLKKELLVKIKEIKGLSSDFKNSVAKEVAQTKIDLQHFNKSLEDAKFNPQAVQPKSDPYLTKIILDKQIKRQLLEENYLHEAYINLQSSGKELEKVVFIEVQNALTVYAKLLGEQAQNVFDKLISNLDYGFLTKQPSFEWDQFVAKDKNFIDENLPKRDYRSVQYDKSSDPLTLEIRSDFLEKRSKFFKTYTKGFYVLTPSFVHEFKTADRKKDLIPIMSLPLDDIELEEYSKKDSNQTKFVLKKVGKMSSTKYIFRAESYDSMLAWYNDIKNLKNLKSPTSRGAYAFKNHTKSQISRVSSNVSRVARPKSIQESTHETDTILSIPNNNQSLPQQSNGPVPQSSIVNNVIYVKELGKNPNNSYIESSSPQQNPQRNSLPPRQQQSNLAQQVQQQRYSLQLTPQQQQQVQQQQQSSHAPYPTQQPFLEPHISQLSQERLGQFQPGGYLNEQSSSNQLSQSYQQQSQPTAPGVYVEAPTPTPLKFGVSPQLRGSHYRNSIDSLGAGLNNQEKSRSSIQYEPDISDDNVKKETHTGDDSLTQSQFQFDSPQESPIVLASKQFVKTSANR